MLSTTSWGGYGYHLHFIDEEIETQQGSLICSMLHSY